MAINLSFGNGPIRVLRFPVPGSPIDHMAHSVHPRGWHNFLKVVFSSAFTTALGETMKEMVMIQRVSSFVFKLDTSFHTT